VESGKIPSLRRFADVLLRKDRCDLTMPLGQDDAIVDSLNEVLRESAAGQTIKAILGKGSVLYELSCLISDPGSQRQNIHPDTPYLEGKDAVLYTCFIALQDIRPDMGPTTWLPGTHTAEAHEAFQDSNASGGAESRKDVLIRTNPSVLGLLPKGCCAIFDSRCLHCGTANRSDDDSRALFYFSFKDKNVGYPGNPASIRPEVGAAQLTMEDLEQDLASYSKGKGHPMIDQIGKSLK
jgi:ectoine hydroxylase-related dioxygenase (phytanoyl-CoA dioxygenase family)